MPFYTVTDSAALTGALIAAAVFFPLALVAWRTDRRDLADRRAREAAQLSGNDPGRRPLDD